VKSGLRCYGVINSFNENIYKTKNIHSYPDVIVNSSNHVFKQCIITDRLSKNQCFISDDIISKVINHSSRTRGSYNISVHVIII